MLAYQLCRVQRNAALKLGKIRLVNEYMYVKHGTLIVTVVMQKKGAQFTVDVEFGQ